MIQIDETQLFIASCEISLLDFLKTDIAKGKAIHCTFPIPPHFNSHSNELNRKQVRCIRFSDTTILTPPYSFHAGKGDKC